MSDISPIRNDTEHAAAVARIGELWDAVEGTLEHDQLTVLATLVNAYEETRWPISTLDPVDAIVAHMDTAGYTRADLAQLLGSRPRASEILNRRRRLTMDMAWRLSSVWKIPAECLLRPYALRTTAR